MISTDLTHDAIFSMILEPCSHYVDSPTSAVSLFSY